MRPIRTETDLDHVRRSVQAYAVLSSWVGTGLFAALADGRPRRPDELPGDPRAIALTAPILAHVGLLCGDGETWSLSRTARALFEAGCLSLDGASTSLGDLSRLDAVLRDGGPARGPNGASRVTEGGVREQDVAGARAFMDMLFRRSEHSATQVAACVAGRLPAQQGGHVLDLGGGHGRYGHALVELGFRVTLLDRPVIVDLARERYGDALTYVVGDFLEDPLGGPYDAVLLSNIVHGLGPDENRRLLPRVGEALRPGGLVVVKDMFVDDLGAHPAEAVFFGLTMLMYTREGQAYSLTELRDLCTEAGLDAPSFLTVPDGSYTLLFARRPGV